MERFIKQRIGWMFLIAVVLIHWSFILTSAQSRLRLGLTPLRENLVAFSVSALVLAGFIFCLGPLAFWPSVGAVLSIGLEVNGLSALQHTLLLVLVGLLIGLVHDGLRETDARTPLVERDEANEMDPTRPT